MKIQELLEAARARVVAAKYHGAVHCSDGKFEQAILDFFEEPTLCGWPVPEIVEKSYGKMIAWEPLGADIDADEARSIIAMLAHALAGVES